MGTLRGHLLHGLGIMSIGLWHLHNITKNYADSPDKFRARPWYPTKRHRRAELAIIIAFTATSIIMETVVSPRRHVPWDADGSLPLSHMNGAEHSLIAFFFLVFAAAALIADCRSIRAPPSLLYAAATAAFVEELLIFVFHSNTDHAGAEGRYHAFLQVAVGACAALTVAEGACPRSVTVAVARAGAVVLQGLWLVVMAFALWLPAFAPKGCRVGRRRDVFVLTCKGSEGMARARGLANIEFSVVLGLVLVGCLGLILYRCGRSPAVVSYHPIEQGQETEEDACSP
eukprot:TRINITY_DN21156_c0_g1_i1.p1 TRINITY_DN21156_c0_g1~~TRINITY_DN21156_c0_g1_i1.p1  ORF type:complete len:286 (+),score=-36.31 TRINITY_DN21156_c0_g1_i1:171-1028(+)